MRSIFVTLGILFLCAPALADSRDEAIRLNEEGILLVKRGEHRKAIEIFTKARRLLPGDLTLRKNLATARSELGTRLMKAEKHAEGIRQFRLAVALEPGVAAYHANLGIALAKTGGAVEAKKVLERAILVDPLCAPAHAELGSLRYKEGELAGAVLAWEKAVKLAPGRKDIEEALARAKKELEVEKGHTKETSAHFEISWDGSRNASVGARVLRILEDAYEQVGVELEIYPQERVRVILYGEKEFKTVTGAQEWVGGLYDGRIRIPVKNFSAAAREIRNTIFHEYTHVALRAVVDECPAWLNEGLAQYFEGKDPRSATYRVKKAKSRLELMGLSELRASFTRFKDAEKARLAYAQALSLALFLIDEHGPERIGRFLKELGKGEKEEKAAEAAFHRSLKHIYLAWEGEV